MLRIDTRLEGLASGGLGELLHVHNYTPASGLPETSAVRVPGRSARPPAMWAGKLSPLDSGIHSSLYNLPVATKRQETKPLRAGELAKAAGVSTDTLRHYERKGVLPAPRRSPNGYREYPAEALDRVRLVRRALAIGFTLGELARLLKARDGGGVPCREVRALAAGKLSDVEARLRGLRSLREELRATLRDWDDRLARTEGAGRASLLESLTAAEESDGRGLSPLAPAWRRRKRKAP